MIRRTLDTDQVVLSAAVLADTEGLDVVTLTRVAERLGVRQPALYRHVDSYDGLLRALGLRGRELLAERLSEAAVGLAGDYGGPAGMFHLYTHAWFKALLFLGSGAVIYACHHERCDNATATVPSSVPPLCAVRVPASTSRVRPTISFCSRANSCGPFHDSHSRKFFKIHC